MKDEFRTMIQIGSYAPAIGVNSRVMLMGSCFADNIGLAFSRSRLPALVNPTGVVYNPFSIIRSLEMLLDHENIEANSLVSRDERWHHFDFHGQFSRSEKSEAVRSMNQALEQGRQFLKEASYLILTLGTAYVYKRADNGSVVANCHKFPEQYFVRELADYHQVVEGFQSLIPRLRDFNPALNILFTVSPVRHWKDGAHGNQVSKSVLFLAVEALCQQFGMVNYFPAYEIVMDELRDYRFYEEDMLHPSSQAVKYIWSCFVQALFSPIARDYIRQTAKVAGAREHRLLGSPTSAYLLFLKKTLALIDNIENKYRVSHLQNDRLYFKSLINKYS